jgi:hypothetical protein
MKALADKRNSRLFINEWLFIVKFSLFIFNVETIFENIFVCGWYFAENITGAKLISKKAFDILDVCPNLDFQMLCM